MKRFAIPFLDVQTLLVLVLLLLIFAALMKVSDADTKAKVESSSRYLITLTWRDGSTNDVDLWVQIPTGDAVGFRNRQAAFVSLDHDDLGLDSNTVVDAEGNTITLKRREEVVYIRQTIPGTYVVAAHLYSQHDATPEPVTVTIAAVEPRWHIISERKLILTEAHEEQTAARFTVDQAGNITSTDSVPELFVNERLAGK